MATSLPPLPPKVTIQRPSAKPLFETKPAFAGKNNELDEELLVNLEKPIDKAATNLSKRVIKEIQQFLQKLKLEFNKLIQKIMEHFKNAHEVVKQDLDETLKAQQALVPQSEPDPGKLAAQVAKIQADETPLPHADHKKLEVKA